MDNHLLNVVIVFLVLASVPLLMGKARAQEEALNELFSQAKSNPALRAAFIEVYIQNEGLPQHVILIQYSDQLDDVLATTNPLVRANSGSYQPTSHALAIGRGYPSRITFGPEMFEGQHHYAEFLSVTQHEAAHARFWATGDLDHMEGVDTGKNSKVRLRGLLPILFELDALKSQMDHFSWRQTSLSFRQAQEAYRQKWLDKLEHLEQQSYVYDMKPLLDRIRRTYK
jgi:hypothetical protein